MERSILIGRKNEGMSYNDIAIYAVNMTVEIKKKGDLMRTAVDVYQFCRFLFCMNLFHPFYLL